MDMQTQVVGIIGNSETIVRKAAVRVVDFRFKLNYWLQSQVTKVKIYDKDLAEYVGISPVSLSQYILGSQTREAERLPIHHVGKFLELFQIKPSQPYILTDYSIKDFRAEVIVPQYTKNKNGLLVRLE